MSGGRILGAVCCAVSLIATGAAGAATPVSDAIDAAGGSQLAVRAGDAIHATCMDLAAATGQGVALTGAQQDLFGRCGDMVQTVLSVVGENAQAQNRFGLSDDEQVYATLRQFSGEEASTLGRYATEGTNLSTATIAGRLSAIRTGVRTNALAMSFSGIDVSSIAPEAAGMPRLIGGSAGDAAEGDVGLAWFGKFDYGFGDRDTSANEDGYDADSFGGTLGFDYAFANGLVLGIAGGYVEHEIDFDSVRLSATVDPVSGGAMDIETWSVSGFFDYHWGATYASGIATYGDSDYDMTRLVVVPASTSGAPAQSRSIISETTADQYSGSVQVGRTFGETATTYDIYGAFRIAEVQVDDFTETDLDGGSLALAFDDQKIESRQWILGGTVRRAFNTGAGVLVPYATAEWHREIANDARFVDARYALAVGDVNGDGRSINFALPTDDPDENYFEVIIGVAGQLANNIVVFAEYDAVVGLEDTTANLVSLGIRGTF